MESFFIKAEWDDEAKVWYIADADVPGLAAESSDIPSLLSVAGT